MALSVMINGQARTFDGLEAGATVLDLVGSLQLQSDRVALELNGEIASRAAWGEMTVADGDKVEVVHFVGGGSAERRELAERVPDPPSQPGTMGSVPGSVEG